jgi:hypothetical protein
VFLVAAACSSGQVAPPDASPRAVAQPKPKIVIHPAPPVPSLAFGPEVTSLRVRRSIEARFAPRQDAKSLGVVESDTRVGWQDSSTTGPGCPRWIEIEPRGWICDKYLEPTKKQPVGAENPRLKDGEIVPGVYGKVVGAGAKAWKSAADILGKKAARDLAGSVTVRKMDEVEVAGKKYWKTSSGELIEATKIQEHKPSTFAGVRLDAEGAPGLPIAWAQSRKNLAAKVEERTTESRGSRAKKSLAPRTMVVITGTSKDGKSYQLADGGWIDAADVHVARASDPPPDTLPDERWLDVDLDEQVVVAFEGTHAVYATMVSSGQPKYATPAGLYRIWMKLAETDMNGQMGDEQPYSVATVPWTMFFAKDLAFHTAYWHDRFGEARSHGCVNLSPIDARALYAWASPDVPPGWSAAQGIVERPGSPVRIHSAAQPATEFRGYAKAVHERLIKDPGKGVAKDGQGE